MEIKRALGEAGDFIFTFIKNRGKTVDIAAPSLLDAKIDFQVRFGYWPEGTVTDTTNGVI